MRTERGPRGRELAILVLAQLTSAIVISWLWVGAVTAVLVVLGRSAHDAFTVALALVATGIALFAVFSMSGAPHARPSSGGRNLNGFGGVHTKPAAFATGWSDGFGHLQLRLRDGGYDWRFMPAVRQPNSVDSGSASCH